MENIYEFDVVERDLSYLEEDNTEEKEPFKIKDLNGANWAFRKLKAIEEQEKEIKRLADKEFDRIDEWLKTELARTDRDKGYFEGLLTAYLITEREKDPKFKVSTPYGKVSTRKQQPNFEYDVNKFIDWAIDNEREDLVKITKTPIKAEVKKVFEVHEGRLIDPETGEIVAGVEVIDRPDSVIVKVAE